MSTFFYKIYNSIYIKSIRRGLLKVQPIILINCIFIIILNINNDSFMNIMNVIINDNWKYIFNEIYKNLYVISKLLIVISICSELAKIRIYEKQDIKYMGNSVSSNMVGFIGLTSAITFSSIFTMEGVVDTGSSVIIAANWTLLAIVVSILFSEIYIKIYYYMLDSRKTLINSYERVVRQSILAIIPSVLTIITAIGLAFLIDSFYFSKINGVDKITIYGANSFFNDIKYIFIKNALWVIGGHGGDLIVHDQSFNRLYVDTFTNMGGAGSTICLIIAIILYSSNKYRKKISHISIIPSIFNINETITYGLPILFNPIYIIPLTLTPIVQYVIAQGVFELGLVEIVNTNMSWTHPILFNAYKLTGGFSGLILQIINIIVGVVIYTPFVKISDNMSKRERQGAYEKLKNTIFSGDLEKLDLSSGTDSMGEISIFLGEELKEILTGRRKNEDELYLEYQPQVNKERKVVGVEALLRWKHEEFGNIQPNIIVLIAEEVGLIYPLGKWIAKEAIEQLSIWDEELEKKIDMSINASTKQLTDDTFANYIKDIIKLYNVNPNNIKVEITESFAIGEDDVTKEQLTKLTECGVKLAIDDFGVGYNPLLYIKKYNIDSIKIDGSLIKDIDTNEESKSIVSSVYNLCESTGITVINEFLETENQKAVLDKMGDGLYQGYLFSKPLKADECVKYINNNI
ncbi:EAL domain-containing protein [Clostridium sp.]|uniref:EAL domain-containing protein n=1 Tax=Clostridium sp. TaxID=1506 RepID=UPI003F40918A